MPVTITRTAWIDDDGSGTTGTVINNAVKTELYNQIDAGFAALDAGGTGDFTVAGALTVNGAATFNGPLVHAGDITTGTVDGSDNQFIGLCGGGFRDAARGAYVFVAGNDTAFPGALSVVAGAMPSATVLCLAGTAGGVVLNQGATAWAAYSDARHKADFTPFTDAMAKVATLRAGTGRYVSDATTRRRAFLIGQEVQAILPEAVDTDPDGLLLLRYTDVIPLLVAAVQELSAKLAK